MPFRDRSLRTGFLPLVVLVSLLSDPSSAAISKRNPWAAVPGPTPGVSESIGHYSAGCLRGGERLRTDGPGFQAVRISRNRHYGHPVLVSFLESLGEEIAKQGEPSVLIGDMGLPRGGPTKSAHQSHQTGLDADLWYWRPGRTLSRRERENLSAKRMVSPKKLSVVEAFGASEVGLLRRVASKENVDRVLVNFAVKQALCERHANEDWVRKIRPWYGHDYHFHVRLRCPASDTACQSLPEIPAGNGCDESLAWWWSDEARFPKRAKRRKERSLASERSERPKRLELPDACDAVLAGR